jgi:NADPH:quinone reductase-like Zn-dependent oxidoreductase
MAASGAIATVPSQVSLDDAIALPFGGTTALYFLRDVAGLKRRERLLVNGASGAVGLAAVQLGRHFGARVTGVTSPANAALVSRLGADEVIDYRTVDFAAIGERWDVIMDTVGNAPLSRVRNALGSGGRLLLVSAGLGAMVLAPLQSMRGDVRVAGGVVPERAADLRFLLSLHASGEFKPVVDSRYPLERIREAHARVDTGRKTGSVAVTVSRA